MTCPVAPLDLRQINKRMDELFRFKVHLMTDIEK